MWWHDSVTWAYLSLLEGEVHTLRWLWAGASCFTSRTLIWSSKQPQSLLLYSDRASGSLKEYEEKVKQLDQTRGFDLLQKYIKAPSIGLNTQALHSHILQRLAHSGKTFLQTEEAAAAVPFMLWCKTSKWPYPNDSAACSLAKIAACFESPQSGNVSLTWPLPSAGPGWVPPQRQLSTGFS